MSPYCTSCGLRDCRCPEVVEQRLHSLERDRNEARAEVERLKEEYAKARITIEWLDRIHAYAAKLESDNARLKAEISAHDAGAHVIDTRGVERARELTEAHGRIGRLEKALQLIAKSGAANWRAAVNTARQALDKEAP